HTTTSAPDHDLGRGGQAGEGWVTESVALPDPALVVLVGAAGSGKSTWAAAHYRTVEVVSSDALRAVVGSGTADLDASVDAFDVLERVVAARLRRGLTVVVDTLGLDPPRRRGWLEQARASGIPAVAVVLDTPDPVCRQRNSRRDRPVPAAVLTTQLRRVREVVGELAAEGWERVVSVAGGDADVAGIAAGAGPTAMATASGPAEEGRPRMVLQLSAFPWGEDPAAWVTAVALAADAVGLHGIALMDHLIQIPQVGRAWDPIPEPFVTLGLLAGLDTQLALGTLVSPVTFRRPGLLAKAVATLDVLSSGRAFCGVGAGWWEREHAAYGLEFPRAGVRLDLLEEGIETMRALWASGTKPYAGQRISLPETTSYPRPVHDVPIIVGGAGERTLRIAGRLADGCNVPADDRLPARVDAVRAAARDAGRDPGEVEITVLDVAIIGGDRHDTAARVERTRGRVAATTWAARHHAGEPAAHAERYRALAELGVGTVFLALPDLTGPDDLAPLVALVAALRP
ncbi:MAG: LLM class flavin-dependent oxidoreductase, partial [Lapillicoccus sp.]